MFSPEDRGLYTHCLGNLVLTNDNRVYSNYCFTRKRDGVTGPDGRRSACYMTSVLKQEQALALFSEWTPEQVVERQDQLASWAMDRWKVTVDPVTAGTASAVDDEEVLDDDALDADPMIEDPAAEATDWDWDTYASRMQIPPDRIEVARRTVEGVAAAVAPGQQPWRVKFRKGYVAFQRTGGHNVILVDLVWNRPVRLAIRLPTGCTPASLGLRNPFPQLEEIWLDYAHEWGWKIPSARDIPDLGYVVDLAGKYSARQEGHPAGNGA